MLRAKKNGKEILFDWLLRNGWNWERYGHFRKGNYRMKLQVNSVREEYRNALGEWRRTRSGNYSKLTVDENDQLVGLSKNI